jgi:photosystem II stability/assembly factor-like uncharacterized protein
MSETFWRGLARSCAVLAGLVITGAVGEPAQEAPESRDTQGSIRQMQRLDVDEGWVLTDAALLFTRDGGATWSDMAPGQPLDRVSDAFFLDPAHAWLAGLASGSPDRLKLLDTSDGGASWRQQEVPASALPLGQVYAAQVHFSDAEHGWFLGRSPRARPSASGSSCARRTAGRPESPASAARAGALSSSTRSAADGAPVSGSSSHLDGAGPGRS